jgi:two-component system chemotaxis sensor kinase CheA
MDFVSLLCDEIESEKIISSRADDSVSLAGALRGLIARPKSEETACADKGDPMAESFSPSSEPVSIGPVPLSLSNIPETARMEAYRRSQKGDSVYWLSFKPEKECFFHGDDPFFTVRQTPGLLWGGIVPRDSWPPLAELDAYSCNLDFHMLAATIRGELNEHFRYVLDQVNVIDVKPLMLVIPQGNTNGGPVYDDFVSEALHQLQNGDISALRQAALTMIELSNPELWSSSALRWLVLLLESAPDNYDALWVLIESIRTLTTPDFSSTNPSLEKTAPKTNDLPDSISLQANNTLHPLSEEEVETLETIFASQRMILMLDDHPEWHPGRLKAAAATLINCCMATTGDSCTRNDIQAALEDSLNAANSRSLLAWLDTHSGGRLPAANTIQSSRTAPGKAVVHEDGPSERNSESPKLSTVDASQQQSQPVPETLDETPKFGRRAEDAIYGSKVLKVDQSKIDRLMNLIGEMVVSKNALPYLAQRAENQYGVRELSREIKAQYAVINRIAEEMQDGIMQVRMMPVSFVFQRFPRLVRDLSRKLGKDIQLVLDGEETEADKNIIESLADPLIHIVRNSLDHGLETPDVRLACGKPETGTLTIRAAQEADRVIIEIIDDGRGIDPAAIKRKAYEKGVIDEAALERISDREAINLVFAPGFSTVETVSDISGRGVGMDVVRNAVAKVNGSIVLESNVGKGTHIRISLPLSMAVTKVMIIETDRQIFGVPMDHVMETVRVPRSSIHTIKQSHTVVLRGRIVPLKSLNSLLNLDAEPRANADDELAMLVARVNSQVIGIMVDDFRETVDVIQKPLNGVLSGLAAYSGSALMGDGSVLMVLNLKEIV